MSEVELTPEEEAYLQQLEIDEARGLYPKPEEKPHIIGFFKKVIAMRDNTKTANLTKDELGFVRVPVRTNLELSHYCRSMSMYGLSNYFSGSSQITNASSLSREGFLDRMVVTQKKESELKKFVPTAKSGGLFSKPKTEEM